MLMLTSDRGTENRLANCVWSATRVALLTWLGLLPAMTSWVTTECISIVIVPGPAGGVDGGDLIGGRDGSGGGDDGGMLGGGGREGGEGGGGFGVMHSGMSLGHPGPQACI